MAYSHKDKKTKQEETAELEYMTTLRKDVAKLLAPHLERSKRDREIHDELKGKYDQMMKRIEDIEFAIHKSDKRQTVFEEIYEKITNLDTARKKEELDLLNKIEVNRKSIEELNINYKDIGNNLESMDERTLKILQDVEAAMRNMDKFKDGTNQLVNQIHHDSVETSEKIKDFGIKVEEQFQKLTSQFTENRAYTQNHEISLSSLKNHVSEMQGKVNSFDRNLKESNNTISSFEKHIDSIKSLSFKIENFELQLRTNENYLEKYLPLYTQSQLSECLHSCLVPASKKKLFLYEERKFRELNTDILNDDGMPDIKKRMEKVSQILEPTIKRYSRANAADALGFRKEDEVSSKSGRKTDVDGTPGQTQRKSETDRSNSQSHVEEQDKTDRSSPLKREDAISAHTKTDQGFQSFTQRTDDISQISPQKVSTKQRFSSKIDEKPRMRTNLMSSGGHHEDDEDEEEDGENFYVKPKDFRLFKEEVFYFRDEIYKRAYNLNDELGSLQKRMVAGQEEISDTSNLLIRDTISQVQEMIDKMKNDRADNMMLFSDYDKKLVTVNLFQEKTFQFFKKLSDTVTPLIECINGMLAIILKEEKEKKTLYHMLSQNQVSQFNHTAEDFGKRFSQTAHNPKQKNHPLPYLPGQRFSNDSGDGQMNEIKFKHNGQTISKLDFLEITHEAFKPCMQFATKYRMTPNFNQIFESDFVRPPSQYSTPNKKGSNEEFSPTKLNERFKSQESEEDQKREKVNVPFSKANITSYNNYKYGMPDTRALSSKNRFYQRNSLDKSSLNKTFY